MRIPIISRYIYFLTLVLLVSLVGCSVPAAPTASPTSILASSTSTLSPTAVPSSMPSPELPTDAPTPSSIPPTRTPHPTPAPTLTADEEQVLVLDLLQDNGGCRLPCWWGFTPGETLWQTAEAFFTLYGKRVFEYKNPPLTIYSIFFYISRHDLQQLNQDYIVEDSIVNTINVHAVPPTRGDEFVYGDAQFAKDWERYMLSQMLSAYGQPSQIFLGVYIAPTMPFDLLLFYPEKGILVRYTAPAERVDSIFRMCPYRTDITLWLWPPERDMSLEYIANVGGFPMGDDMSYFQSLAEATGMSAEQFYQTFAQPGNQTCLETPADMW